MKILNNSNKYIYIISAMLKRYNQHEVGATSAYLAYFFILSIFPFLIFLNALISFINISPDFISSIFSNILPQEVTDIISHYLDYIKNDSSTQLFSFGIITTIFSASKAFGAVINALDKAYKNTNIKPGLYRYVVSILGTLIFGCSIIISFILISIGNDFWIFLSRYFSFSNFFLRRWDFFKWIIVFVSLFFSLATVHYIIQSKKIKFKQIIPGTIFSIFMWLIVSLIYTYFIKNFSTHSVVYGSLGTIIILLLWLYLTGIIVVMGGELNQILMDYKK